MNSPHSSQIQEADTLQVSEADLHSYVDGSLSAPRRTKIEGFLACNPDLAANVMHAMHRRERSRVASGLSGSGRRRVRIGTVALCVTCAVAGWAVAEGLDDEGPFDDLKSTPEYVEDAVMSQRITHVRIGMSSQVETPQLDPREIERATSIRMPTLPATWRLLDTQIYPSEEGPGVSVLMETSMGKKINLFAVRADTSADGTPNVAREQGENAAYWESSGAAYVITGDGSAEHLLGYAIELSRSSMM
jgi:anti-sigma factor RsiW